MKKIFGIVFLFMIIFSANTQWVQIPNGIGPNSFIGGLASIGNNIFASTWDTAFVPGSVYISTNSGNSWTIQLTLINDYDINCLASIGNNVIAGADRNLWISTNNGANWFVTLPNQDVLGLDVVGTSIFAGTYWSGSEQVYRSDNNGLNWTSCGLNKVGYCFTKLGINVFAGTSENGVYISSNNGNSWTQTSLINKHVHAIAALDGKVFAGTDTGMYVSSNNGSSWSITSINSGYVFSIIISNNNILASVPQKGIYLSTNNGVNWILKNEGLPSSLGTLKMMESNGNLFLGTYGNSVYKRPSSQVFGINQISTEIPGSFNLYQNYPNPFNPATKIRFDVPKSGNVEISVNDMLGRKVTSLVDQKLRSGTFETEWNASDYPSGVYYYKLTTDGVSETKKMVLLK